MGEIVIRTSIVPGGIVTQGFQQPNTVRVLVNVKAFLQGPYNPGSGAMNDGLRTNGLIPTTEPYTALGYSFIGGGGESTTQAILDFPGSNAIIDWVLLELRDRNDNTNVLHSRSALLQADGDIVAMDGFSPVDFPLGADDYYLAVLHRNHLAVVSLSPIALSRTATTVDLSDGSTPTYGSNAQQVLAGTYLLWAGDVNSDGTIKYTGSSNDRDPILSAIGGTVPTNTVTGYRAEDVNMDGTTKYSGAGNDRDIILQNIGGVVPTNTRVEQVP
ncbi:MAG: hemagglutinin protein [Flavobacteriales bacterium]